MARLWPLPLLAGLLPLLATVLAWSLSVREGTIPDCNPFLEGCVSISRAARHGLANVLFRGLVLPAAALQAACWMLAVPWLTQLGAPRGRWLRALPALGIAAGVALVAYGTFLGVEGEGYRTARRYAIPLYFGFTCLCMLVVARHAHRELALVCACLPLLGLVHLFVPLALATELQRDALENVTEWWAGAIFTAYVLALAWAWWRTDMRLRFEAEDRR